MNDTQPAETTARKPGTYLVNHTSGAKDVKVVWDGQQVIGGNHGGDYSNFRGPLVRACTKCGCTTGNRAAKHCGRGDDKDNEHDWREMTEAAADAILKKRGTLADFNKPKAPAQTQGVKESTAGIVKFCFDIQIEQAAMKEWEPDRIKAFFDGIAQARMAAEEWPTQEQPK